MNETLDLPFEYTHDSLDSWLTILSKVEDKVAASQIYNVLKLINSKNTRMENLFLVFNTLAPIILHLTSNLELLPENEINIPQKTHKLSRLNSHLVRTLAHGYFDISVHPEFESTFNASEQPLVISQAINYYGQTQKLNALNYDFPSTSVWKNLGLLYQQADKAGLVSENEPNGAPITKGHSGITKHIKRILLFAIFNPYQYSQNDISTIYSLFEQHANLLVISRSDYKNDRVATCFWDFHSNSPPQPDKPLRADVLLINTDKIVDHLYSSTFFSEETNLPTEIRKKIQTGLSSYNNIFKDITPAPPEPVNIIHGFQLTVDYLEKEVQRNKFFQAAPKINHTLQHKIIEIEPMDQQQGKTHTALANKWVGAVNLPGAATGSFFQTQDPDFNVVVLQNVQLKLNDLAIINTGKKTIYGIIRQHQNAPVINTQQYLLESVHGKFSFIQISDDSINKKTGLLIENKNKSLEVILSPEKISSGSVIQIYSDKYKGNYYLTRLIELTPNFLRYHIISC